MMLTPLVLFAAAKLSATDLRDLHCLYAFESRAVAESAAGEKEIGAADQNVAQWFRGRLSASQPQLRVFDYIQSHFYVPKVIVTPDDIRSCSAVIGAWERREAGPIR